MAYDVFISHSSVDKNVADATCSWLERHGIRCWIAPRDIQPGANWGGAIIKAIRSCRVMVLIFSSHANSSEQIKREVERAVSVGATVIPMRIEEVVPQDDLDYFLSAAHWLDAMSPPLETHLERLAQAVKELLSALPVRHPDSGASDMPEPAPPVVLQTVVPPAEPPPVYSAPPPVYAAAPPVYSAPPAPPVAPMNAYPPPAPKPQRTWLIPVVIGSAVLAMFVAGIFALVLIGLAVKSDHKDNKQQTPAPAAAADITKDTPLDEVQRRADAGEADAQFELGYRYDMGNGGVQQDYDQARTWYEKAAAQGDITAENNLGYMYQNALGVTKDYSQAFALYQKAAAGGSDSAENNLGFLYQNGYGVAQDYAQALSWYQKAAASGNTSSQNSIGYLYQNGWGVDKDYNQAMAWYQKAAAQGNNSAENNLGYLYQNGLGVAQDFSQALDWYQKSADKGNSSAMFNIAYMYENGLGVDKDVDKAVDWYRKAAAHGDTDAPDSLKRLGYTVNP